MIKNGIDFKKKVQLVKMHLFLLYSPDLAIFLGKYLFLNSTAKKGF